MEVINSQRPDTISSNEDGSVCFAEDSAVALSEVTAHGESLRSGVYVLQSNTNAPKSTHIQVVYPELDQEQMQQLANEHEIILPVAPNDTEKLAYVKTNSGLLLGYLFFSLVCVTAGMWLFALCSPYFYGFGIFNVYMMVYLTLSYYTGLSGDDYDFEYHDQLKTREIKDHPSVDIYLPTCGEPLVVLQNTYEHVKRIDWPNLRVWVLDDGAKDAVQALASEYKFNYIRRPDRPHLKKAGNLRYAFSQTDGEYYMILDADFCPRADIIKEMMPILINDPEVAILQTPQYFRVRNDQSWVEQGAGLIQELFYRVIETKYNRFGSSICVGTSAIYRRQALKAFGGVAEIEHSEDVHTGFNVMADGWKVEYLPLCLSMGVCPGDLKTFFNQQYRWASGSATLVLTKRFWKSSLTISQKLCFTCGMLYYFASAMEQIIIPLPGILLTFLLPNLVRWYNVLFAIPSLFVATLCFWAWSRHSYKIQVLKVQIVQAYAHMFAIKDSILGTEQGWVVSGGAKVSGQTRFTQARTVCMVYVSTTLLLLFGGSVWQSFYYPFYDFIPSCLLGLLQLYLCVQFMMNWD
ncbi:nucleotide-diphospho-sugar transferase [Globomyces pollinis-pini]|nr:nucleotide-diphospho-sugar transferase [Globomyces pollinis-pini]